MTTMRVDQPGLVPNSTRPETSQRPASQSRHNRHDRPVSFSHQIKTDIPVEGPGALHRERYRRRITKREPPQRRVDPTQTRKAEETLDDIFGSKL
mmetsp:Transcript_26500/g.62865  ORF Transcript_26500/g.62865 Transcript_26500/m.62865 type:complete len:95 (+) Transcript_26500:229-513(+)